MKVAGFSLFLVLLACNSKIGTSIISKQPPLSDTAYVLVLKVNDKFINDGIKVGSIKAGDNGFTSNCSYYEVLAVLKRRARENGANVIKLTDRRFPGRLSTCDRLEADIYRVPDYRKHEIEITWREDRPLTWNDFRGAPPEGYHRFAAASMIDIELESNNVTAFSKAKFFTKAVFHSYASWVNPKAKTSGDLLKHEQLHFDLAEIYRRMLEKRLMENSYNLSNLETARAETKKYFTYYKQRAALYDEETNHGLTKDKQAEWNKMVAKELADLKEFENHID